VHAVQAVEREHAHAVGASPDVADRAGPHLDLARILRRPARWLRVGDERSVGDVLEREVPREVVRYGLDLTAEIVRERPRVVAEAPVKRSHEPLTAIGIRKESLDPRAEAGRQGPSVPGFLGLHAASVARLLTPKPGPPVP
jgi:hypothetical protein